MVQPRMSDIQDLSTTEVETKIKNLKRQLFDLRFQKATQEAVKPHEGRLLRRQIAQLMTLQRQRQLSHTPVAGEGVKPYGH